MENLILLPIFVDSCSNTSTQFGTGSSSECLEGVTSRLVLAKDGFTFATLASFRTQADWNTAIQAKNLVPLYDVYEVAGANTEATKYETGNFSYVTEKEVKKMTAESYLSVFSHRALKSYQASDYTQVFEITDKNEILGVYHSDGVQIKGQDITEFDVAIRERPTNDKPAFSMITVTYRDFEEFEDNGVVIKSDWSPKTIDGIFDLTLQVSGTPSSTEIVVGAYSGGGSTAYEDIVVADWSYTGGTISGSTYAPSTGLYTLTGTGLTSGTLTLNGVIDHAGTYVQTTQGLSVTI